MPSSSPQRSGRPRPLVVSLVLAAVVAASAGGGRAAAADPPEASSTRAALDVLVARGGLVAAADWEADLAPGTRVDGERAATILVTVAGLYVPVASVDEAIAELGARRIILSPDSWRSRTSAGTTCAGKDLAVIVHRVASRFWRRIPVPRSFAADPLSPRDPQDLADRYDVVIAGAGTGGCAAAIQAARLGVTVLLVEESDWVGGQAFAAGVTSMDEGRPFVRERGLYRELCGLIQAHYEPLGIDFVTAYQRTTPAVEPRVGRELVLRMLADARKDGTLDLALRSRVTAVQRMGDRVVGVTIARVAGAEPAVTRVSCGVLIDATEWGDVIPLTGARYRVGGTTSTGIDPHQQVQNLTWTAVVKQYPDGVPPDLRVATPPPRYAEFLPGFRASLVRDDPRERGLSQAGEPWNWRRFIDFRGMPDSARPAPARGITRTHLNYNNDYPVCVADLEDHQRRARTCRGAALKTLCLLHYIQTELGHHDWSVADDEGYDTPFNRAQVDALLAAEPALAPYREVLGHFPVMPYVRESRRIVGLHTLTAREIERRPGSPVQFRDTVAVGDYAVDLHASMTPENLEPDLDRSEDIPRKFAERGLGPFAIPMRCFIPERVDGLLAAEKNISQSRLANGATRLQPSTLLMGQAAGTIAALAVQRGTQPRAVAADDVQQVLLEAGCILAITPVAAAPGTPEWIAQQRAALRGPFAAD